MIKIFLVLFLSLSASHLTMANEVVSVTGFVGEIISSATTNLTFSQPLKVVALQIQADVQEYFLTGAISPILQGEIKALKSQNPNMSELDAIDMLLDLSSKILN